MRSHATDENTVEMHQAKDSQRLVAHTCHGQVAPVVPDDLEQRNNRSHSTAIDQAKNGQVDQNVRRLVFVYPGYDRSKLSHRESIKLPFNAKGRRSPALFEA